MKRGQTHNATLWKHRPRGPMLWKSLMAQLWLDFWGNKTKHLNILPLILKFGARSFPNFSFQSIRPLGRCFLWVQMSVRVSVCLSVCQSVHFWGTIYTSFCPHFLMSDVQKNVRIGILGEKYWKEVVSHLKTLSNKGCLIATKKIVKLVLITH